MMQWFSITRWQNAVPVFSLLAVVLGSCGRAYAGDLFVKPTAEELAMTSLPGYPGAAAVVLYREEITKDDMHVVLHYDRIKILTEDGKKYAEDHEGVYTLSAVNFHKELKIGRAHV